MELTDEVRDQFRKWGSDGGHAGDPEKKRAAMSGDRVKATADINRTRRLIVGHIPECDCDDCVMYKTAKATLARLRGET